MNTTAGPQIDAKHSGKDPEAAAPTAAGETIMSNVRQMLTNFETNELNTYQVRTNSVTRQRILRTSALAFIAFLAVGLLFSYLMALFEQFPIVGFVLLVLFLSLQLGFFVLDLALGAQLMGALRPWTVVVANLLAASTMAWYLWRRHPRIKETLRHVWDQQ